MEFNEREIPVEVWEIEGVELVDLQTFERVKTILNSQTETLKGLMRILHEGMKMIADTAKNGELETEFGATVMGVQEMMIEFMRESAGKTLEKDDVNKLIIDATRAQWGEGD